MKFIDNMCELDEDKTVLHAAALGFYSLYYKGVYVSSVKDATPDGVVIQVFHNWVAAGKYAKTLSMRLGKLKEFKPTEGVRYDKQR